LLATEAPDAEQPVLQEVIVTGSRIPVPPTVTATSPITQVTSQDIATQGRTDMSDLLNNLPQTSINSSNDFGNTSNPLSAPGGITTVDLRGLGAQRTLVLVNGRRLGNGDPNTTNQNPAPDIDQIPVALIERVDVVTGGASAVYGSDAMAGVVNFVMRRNFQGVEIDGQYGLNEHSNHDSYIQNQEAITGINPPTGTTRNGYKRDLSLIVGTNTNEGAGNITGYFAYHHQDGVPGSKYDFADCLYRAHVGCSDSPNSNQFSVAGSQTLFSVVGNQFLPYPQATSVPPPTFNSSAYEYQQREDDRYQGGVLAHLDVNDYFKPYLEFSFMNDRTTQLVAPSGLFLGGNPFSADGSYAVNCTNPLLSAQELGVLQSQGSCLGTPAQQATENANLNIGRRNVEGGGRNAYFEHTNYRVVAGAGGKFADAWTYDAYAQYYYTTLFNSNTNFLSFSNIDNALQATGTADNPVCISKGSCVPYNIFNQGGVTPAQLAYLYSPGTAYGNNTEKIVHGDITGDLGQYGITLPWAHDGLAINIGAEHRTEGLSFAPDAAELSGELAGFSGASVAINNSYHVSEGFTEIRLPLMQDQPWAKDLSTDVGYRYSNYSTAGVTNTYKFEVQYAPLDDVRLRGSFDRAVRAPNLIELYNPQSYGNQSLVGSDPCAPTVSSTTGVLTPATATLEQCEHTGVTAAQYGNGGTTNTISQCSANQCGQVIGGSPHLQPEIARTWSIGASFTPQALPGFYGTLDYYHIAITGEITQIPANYLFDQCLNTGNAFDCSQVVRTPAGALHGATVAGGGYIYQTDVNAGAALVSGIDLGLAYRYPLPPGWGSLLASMNGAWLQHEIFTPYPGAVSYDCAGLFGTTCNNGVHPKWRHMLAVNWDTPWRFMLSAHWRYIGSTSFDNNSSNPSLAGAELGKYDPTYGHIASYSYLDLTATVHVVKGVDIRIGVNNVFDKDPPLLPAEITNETQNNTYPTYDTLGRQLFVAFTATL
jgi:outer membrane receptor protein involved in Fe transport